MGTRALWGGESLAGAEVVWTLPVIPKEINQAKVGAECSGAQNVAEGKQNQNQNDLLSSNLVPLPSIQSSPLSQSHSIGIWCLEHKEKQKKTGTSEQTQVLIGTGQ